MKNKGFTLIELLAVIVILAIIALIATPIILGIINDARDSARERTAELIAKEVELAYTGYMYKNGGNEPTKFCDATDGYINVTYFTMDKATLQNCNDTNGTVEVKANESNTVYDVAVGTTEGTVTVTQHDKATNTKTVTLTK